MRSPRSRSPTARQAAPSHELREEVLAEFAKWYWMAADPDADGVPWIGNRAVGIMAWRETIVAQVEAAARDVMELELPISSPSVRLNKDVVVRWQRFTFFEDIARMSDVLFRGPIEPQHGDEMDARLHCAWRRLHASIYDPDAFSAAVLEYRVSAVRVAMMLETARPSVADNFDADFEMPDPRTLASLLSLRCQRDDEDELLEMYRLVCQKLHGRSCAWCCDPFDENTTAGLFDGADSFVFPATVPKVFVPQCGHAIHTVCFGHQLVEQRPGIGDMRGCCRRCCRPYGWTSIDVDPMTNAFCLLFGRYVEKRAQEMRLLGDIARHSLIGLAQVCEAFASEMEGLVRPASAWILLTKRHAFSDPEPVEAIGDAVLNLLLPPEPPPDGQPALPFESQLQKEGVIAPEDRSDDGIAPCSDGSGSFCGDPADIFDLEERKHLTEVFLPEPPNACKCSACTGGVPRDDLSEEEADCDNFPPPMPGGSLCQEIDVP